MDDVGSGRRPPRAKRHHHFPKFHLKEFANENGLVWQYDRRGQMDKNPSHIPVGNAGVESNLYAPEVGEDPKTDEFESWLADQVDGPASIAFKQLISGEVLDNKARSSMASYMTSMDLRTPKARDYMLRTTQDAFDKGWADKFADPDALRRDMLEEGGIEVTEEDLERIDSIWGPPKVLKTWWLNFMHEHLDLGAERLWGRKWWLLSAPDEVEFLTSDIGMVKYRGDWTNPVKHMIGWLSKAEGWLMPLTPRLALAIEPSGTPSQFSATAQAFFVKRVNKKIAVQAHRFAYSRQRHDHVLRWLLHS